MTPRSKVPAAEARFWCLIAVNTLIAGLTPIFARMAVREWPPLTLAQLRFAAAGLLLFLTSRAAGKRWAFTRGDLPRLLGVALLCVPINQVGYLIGIKLSNASHGGIAYALTPVLVFWFSLALGLVAYHTRLALATVVSFLGAALVVLSRRAGRGSAGAENASFLAGDALLLLAVTSWSLFLVASRPLVRRHGALVSLSAVFLIGAALHLPLVAVDWRWFELGGFSWRQLTARGVVGALYITLVTCYLNYLLWYRLIAEHDVTRAAVITNSSFLITVLVEVAFFQETVRAPFLGGVVLTLAGVVLATATGWRWPQRPPPSITPGPGGL